MNEKALLYVIFFLFMMILSRFSAGWILREIYDSAGISIESVCKKRLEFRHRKHANRYLSAWIMENSENPTRTARLFKIYHMVTMPPAIFLGLSVTGIFTHIFDKVLDLASMAVLALLIFTAFAGLFPQNRKP